MSESVEDLWGMDVVDKTIRTPLAILREQASLLGPKTNHDISAEVQIVEARDSRNTIQLNFYLTVPALNDYRYRLFSVQHEIPVYPLIINAYVLEDQVHVKDEATFRERLKFIFSAPKTKEVLASLLGHVRQP